MIPDRPLEAPDHGEAVDVFTLSEASRKAILDEVYPEWEDEAEEAGWDHPDEVLEALMLHPVEERWISELAEEYRDREIQIKGQRQIEEQIADDLAEEMRVIAKLPMARRQAW